MTSSELKTQIDSDITDKVANDSVTPTNVGGNMKDIVDFATPYESVYKAKISQSGTSAPTAIVLHNGIDRTITYTRTGVGVYNMDFGGLFSDLDKIDIIVNLQNGSYASPTVIVDNLGILATLTLTYWNGTNFVASDGIIQNATVYLKVNN